MIAVVGLGFVGLTTALGFSEVGFKVQGFEKDCDRFQMLQDRQIPFFEANMQEMLEKHLGHNFNISNHIAAAINKAKIIFICVGTPCEETGKADLSAIYQSIDQLLPYCTDYKVLVIKSTVPPSSTLSQIYTYLEAKGMKVGKDIGLAVNPEFLREGVALNDFMEPDRIVIGVSDSQTKKYMEEIYKSFKAPIHFVSFNTAEFIKYLSNTMLATLISFSNEMAMCAEHIGNVDIASAFSILHQDKRWSGNPASMTSYVYPGCGFGGYCLPKDTLAMISLMEAKKKATPNLLKNVLSVNQLIKEHAVQKIMQRANKKSKIGILGLSFKPNSDDVRDSPAAFIIEKLQEMKYSNLYAYDPKANHEFQKQHPNLNVIYVDSLKEILALGDLCAVVTQWEEFNALEGEDIINLRFYQATDYQLALD